MTAAGPEFNRFGAGDGLRGVGVMCVILAHVGSYTDTHLGGPGSLFTSFFGQDGGIYQGLQPCIYIFFALSGYLIARPFVYALVHERRLPSFSRYAKARLLRIIPAFWLVWTLTLLIDGTRGGDAVDVLSIYGFVQVYHPSPSAGLMLQAWTLDTEAVFYLLLPLVAVVIAYLLPRLPRRLSRVGWLLVALALASVASAIVRVEWNNPAWLVTFPELLVAFTPGIALAVVEAAWLARFRGSERARKWAAALIIAACVIWFLRFLPFPMSPSWLTAWGVPIGALMVAGALMREWTGAPAWRVYGHPISEWIGERSYGIYLVHLLVLRQCVPLFEEIGRPWAALPIMFVLVTAITFVLSALMWRYIEKPAIRLARRRRTPPVATVSEPGPVRAA
jgi:peptidoglycan/LPS O-acetylase OafA/YrhL